MPAVTSLPPTPAQTRRPVRVTFDAIDLTCTGCEHDSWGRVYRMIGNCVNCRTGPLIGVFTQGHEARGGHCPSCGCRKVMWERLARADEVPERRELPEPLAEG